MTLDGFKSTLSGQSVPEGISTALRALWQDARGQWDAAHDLAQSIDDKTGAWIHAYLHRKEGDLENAAYWYRRAGQPVAHDSLEEEWDRIVTCLLQ
jgi:hypothetical protein